MRTRMPLGSYKASPRQPLRIDAPNGLPIKFFPSNHQEKENDRARSKIPPVPPCDRPYYQQDNQTEAQPVEKGVTAGL